MRVQTDIYNVCTFDELSEEAKDKARDWYRSGDDFSFHAECVINDAKEAAKVMGIDIDKVYYSGFWSQGDGACFTGSFTYKEGIPDAIKEYAPQDKKLHDIALLLDLTEPLTASITHRGHYYHSGCMDIDVDSDNREEVDVLKDALRAFANWIYRRLENEYKYQNSNDAVDENIRCNEYEFLEDGRRA